MIVCVPNLNILKNVSVIWLPGILQVSLLLKYSIVNTLCRLWGEYFVVVVELKDTIQENKIILNDPPVLIMY